MNRNDFALLRALDCLLQEANVTRAAERLHMTQPALSAQLARLRRLAGDRLLVPAEQGRGMRLTARAHAMRTDLHDLLRAIEQLVEGPATFDPSTARRDFVVAVNDNTASVIGVDLAQRLCRYGNPGIRLALRQFDRAGLMEQASRGGLDLAITTAPFMPGGMRTQPLFTDRFEVAQRKGHPRGMRKPTLAQYCAQAHVLVSPVGDYRSAIDELLARRGRSRRVAFSVQYYTMVPQLLQRTDCLATLPARFLRRFADVVDCFPLPFKYRGIEFLAGWHPRFDEDPGHQWLRAQLQAVVRPD
ncbi:MAG TPA: LysR family transcriptional regulator [Rhodanobacteraceae bacterium]